MANASIYNAFGRMWQHIVSALSNKADTNHNHTLDDLTDITATPYELNHTTGVTENIQSQINGISTMNTFMTKLNATGNLTDSNTVTVSNATDYDVYVIYLQMNNSKNSISQLIIPRTMISTSASNSWVVSDEVNSKTFTAHFSGTNLILTSVGYSNNGCAEVTPTVYGIKMSIMADESNPNDDSSLGTASSSLAVSGTVWSTNVTGSWQSSTTNLWSGNPSQNNYSYFSRIKLTSPSTVETHTKLVLAVELKYTSYASKCMAILSTSALNSTSVQNSTFNGASSTLTNAAISTCNIAKYADGTDYADGWIAPGNIAYFIFDNVNISANTTYYVYLLPTANNSNCWFESEKSLVSAELYQ